MLIRDDFVKQQWFYVIKNGLGLETEVEFSPLESSLIEERY